MRRGEGEGEGWSVEGEGGLEGRLKRMHKTAGEALEEPERRRKSLAWIYI